MVERLRKAITWRQELDAGAVVSQADIARREGITRARVYQIMPLFRFAHSIQKRIPSWPDLPGGPALSGRYLRLVAQFALTSLANIRSHRGLVLALRGPLLQRSAC